MALVGAFNKHVVKDGYATVVIDPYIHINDFREWSLQWMFSAGSPDGYFDFYVSNDGLSNNPLLQNHYPQWLGTSQDKAKFRDIKNWSNLSERVNVVAGQPVVAGEDMVSFTTQNYNFLKLVWTPTANASGAILQVKMQSKGV